MGQCFSDSARPEPVVSLPLPVIIPLHQADGLSYYYQSTITLADAEQMCPLLYDTFGIKGDRSVPNFLRNMGHWEWLVVRDFENRIVAYLTLGKETKEYGRLVANLLTHQDYRKKGIASQLLVCARRLNPRALLWLGVQNNDPYLQKFYAQRGFQPSRDTYGGNPVMYSYPSP